MLRTCDYCGERSQVRVFENVWSNATEQYCSDCVADFADARNARDDGSLEVVETYTGGDRGGDETGFGDPPSEARRERIMWD